LIVLRSLFYIVIFYITMVYFLPKNEILSYTDAKILKQYKVKQTVQLENKIFGYKAQNSTFSYQNNLVAKVQSIAFNPYLFYNTIVVKNIELQGMAGSLFPKRIENGIIKYSIINPTKISLAINGDFGKATGFFDMTNFQLHLELTPSSIMKRNYSFLLKTMKKSNKKYIYEYKL